MSAAGKAQQFSTLAERERESRLGYLGMSVYTYIYVFLILPLFLHF